MGKGPFGAPFLLAGDLPPKQGGPPRPGTSRQDQVADRLRLHGLEGAAHHLAPFVRRLQQAFDIVRALWLEKANGKAEIEEAHDLAGHPADRDDLKKISGIGPRLEQELNDRGIIRYSDIAGLGKAAVKKLDTELGLEGRITRDDWAGQAKALSGGKG